MLNSNIYFIFGCPCSGKTTTSKILAEKHNMLYFSSDDRRFHYYQYAKKDKHPFMTMDASDFWDWSLEKMIAWERGVISEQTPYILNDLNELSKNNEKVLFEGMLDFSEVMKVVDPKQMVYLSVNKSTVEKEFFERADHQGMLDNILNTPDISDEEKKRRVYMRQTAAIEALYQNVDELTIKTFMREDTKSVDDMVRNVEAYFGFCEI